MPKKACFRKADDRSFYRANARSQKKQSFFWLGTAKAVQSSRAVEGERRKQRRRNRSRAGEGRKQRRRKQSRAGRRPAREKSRSESRGFSVLGTAKAVQSSRAVQVKAGSNGEESRAVQAKATNFHDVLDFISDIPKRLFLPHGGDEGLHQWAECSRHRGSSVYRRRYP